MSAAAERARVRTANGLAYDHGTPRGREEDGAKVLEVPRDWMVEPIEAVAEVLLSNVDKKSSSDEVTVKLCNYMDVYGNARITGGLPFMEATATAKQVEKFGLRPGDVLITKDSEDPSDIAVPSVVVDEFDTPVVCGYHLALLRPRNVDGPYLAWALRSRPVNDQFARRANGTTRFGLTNDVIRSTRIPLPPLPEQRKIAAVLSSVDDAIAATRKVIEQTRRVKQGFLQTLMTRGIGHTRFKQTEIGRMPQAWEVLSIASLASRGTADLQTGPFGTVLKAEEYSEEGVPLISVGEIKVGRVEIREETPRIGPAVVARLPEYVLAAGDIVFARKGGVDRSALIRHREAGWFLGSDGIRLRLNGAILPQFASLYLQRSAVKRWLGAHSTGTTMPTLNQKVLNRLLLPVPQREEQERIVEMLTAIDHSIQRGQEQTAALLQMKRGLMQDLLTGRVRVKAD